MNTNDIIIKIKNHTISIQDEDTQVQIIADDITDMESYIKKLYEWSTSVWDYNAVKNWNTDEYSLLHAQEGFFKVHKLGKDDMKGLFAGEYTDSPESLKDYKEREINAYVYIKISKEEFNKLLNKNEE